MTEPRFRDQLVAMSRDVQHMARDIRDIKGAVLGTDNDPGLRAMTAENSTDISTLKAQMGYLWTALLSSGVLVIGAALCWAFGIG